MSKTSWMSDSRSAAFKPRMTAAKNGSDSTRTSGSGTTRAMDSVRLVTRERAARLGIYPNRAIAASTAACASEDTFEPPLIARDAVERETPAASATSSSVGIRLFITVCSLLTRLVLEAVYALVPLPCRHAVPRSDPCIPTPGRFHCALLCVIVHANNPEALVVAPCPFVVVEQGPREVAVYGHS